MRLSLSLLLPALVIAGAGCGGDPEQPEAPLPPLETPGAPDLEQQQEPSMEDVVYDTVAAAETVLAAWDDQYDPVTEVQVQPVGETSLLVPCGKRFPVLGNAFYCPIGHRIAFDLNMLGSLDSGENQAGAVAFVVLHELGHAYDAEIGFRRGVTGHGTDFQGEQFADCMAGALTTALGGNVEASVRAAFAAGGHVPGPTSTHGTGSQRRDAVTTGLEQGHKACEAYLSQ